MARTPQPGGPPAAAAASPEKPRIRRAVALPLHEGDLDGAAVSEALTRNGDMPAEAVAAPAEENVRPLVTAIPDAAARAEAEVAARTFRPDDGQAGGEAPGRSASQPGKSGHWPLMAAAAVAGAVLVSVPLLSGGAKKTTGADALGKVAVADGKHDAGGATSAPVPDGGAGADVTFPAPTAPATPARSGAPATAPGGDRHGPVSRTTAGHGDTTTGHAGVRAPGHPAPSPSASASPLHGAYARLHGDESRAGEPAAPAALVAVPAQSAEPVVQAGHASPAGTARHAGTGRVAAHATSVESAQEPQTTVRRATNATERTASARTPHAQTSVTPAAPARTVATPQQAATPRRTASARTQAGARTAASASRSQWLSGTRRNWSTKVVHATYVLHAGESVASNRMRITMRSGGDLVISDESGTIRWSSHTHGSGNYAVFQDDGNLAVYSANHTSLWTSGTAGHAGAELVIQNDGNVVILSPSGTALWAAGTAH